MAGKIDKELLKKHHFWFLFIPVGIFLLVAWYGLMFEVSDDIAAKQKNNDDEKKKLASGVKVVPRKALDKFGTQLTELGTQGQRMWKEGRVEQEKIFDWPQGFSQAQRNVLIPLKFGDEIPEKKEAVRDQFRSANVYANEYQKLVDSLKPMQFRDNWETVLRYRSQWGRVCSSEDIWLAMEDFWVQRELLKAIQKVNADAARFTLVGGKDTPLSRQFKSRFWQVDLQVVNNKDNRPVLKGKLTNVSERLQTMGIGNVMKLRVMLSGKPFDFEIEGDSVESGNHFDVKTIDKHTIKTDIKITEIESVEQIFDARTVPVKRIEAVSLNRLSDRNFTQKIPLKMAPFSEAQAKREAGLPTTVAPPPPPAEGADPADAPPPVAAPALPQLSQNDFERSRYIDVTEQVRRMPFGVVLVCDQTFTKDILESLLEIPLRVQITQIDWIRFHGDFVYAAKGTGPKDPGSATVGSTPNTNREDQFSANLMELSVYGIVSLYERTPEPAPKSPTNVKK